LEALPCVAMSAQKAAHRLAMDDSLTAHHSIRPVI
jgi:hypothetical protein